MNVNDDDLIPGLDGDSDGERFKAIQSAWDSLQERLLDPEGGASSFSSPASSSDCDAWGREGDLPGAAHDDWRAQDHALYVAAWANDLVAVRRLLVEGGRPDQYRNNVWGGTALMLAAGHGNAAMLRALLARGASPLECDLAGNDAATWARRRGHRAVVELLQQLRPAFERRARRHAPGQQQAAETGQAQGKDAEQAAKSRL